MKYTVTWLPSAERELNRLYNEASDKPAVTVASDRIDAFLKFDAHRRGEELEEFRYLVVAPLAVLFKVSRDDCLVTVVEVQRVAS